MKLQGASLSGRPDALLGALNGNGPALSVFVRSAGTSAASAHVSAFAVPATVGTWGATFGPRLTPLLGLAPALPAALPGPGLIRRSATAVPGFWP